MATAFAERELPTVRLTPGELTGALGDSVTVLPLVVALGALTDVSLGAVLVLFGLAQAVWGLRYGLPLSVEPMKALVGLAVAGAITAGELVAAGLLAGVVLLAAGRAGWLGAVARSVGEPVVRGVQLAVALLLGWTGLELALAAPSFAAGAAALTLALAALGHGRAATLGVLGLGGALAVAAVGVPAPSLPSFAPVAPAFTAGAAEATAAQLAMTVGNAAVATSLLCSDLFDRDVSPDALAESMGLTCLAAVPLGGLPMCHGSGGLAGKYAFGARTAGANLVLAGLYLGAAAVAGVVAAFPTAVLGVLLVLVAARLGAAAARSDARTLTLSVGALGFLWNVGAAFALGALAWGVWRRVDAGWLRKADV